MIDDIFMMGSFSKRFRDGGDLVGLVVGFDLSQHQSDIWSPGTDLIRQIKAQLVARYVRNSIIEQMKYSPFMKGVEYANYWNTKRAQKKTLPRKRVGP